MTDIDPVDLEDEMSRALARLRTPSAPSSLLPRVLDAAARRTSRPWYTRSWLHWPTPWRVASAVVAAALLGALAILAPGADLPLSWSSIDTVERLRQMAIDTRLVLDAAATAWQAVAAPIARVAMLVAALVTVMATASMGIGAALAHVALGKEHSS